MSDPVALPVLVFDGDCAFCTSTAQWVRRRVRPGRVAAWQHLDLDALGLDAEQCTTALQWVDRHGVVHSAERAVAQMLRDRGGLWAVPGRILGLPALCSSLAWSIGGWRAIGTACPVAPRRVGSEPTPALASQQHYERPVRRARQPGNAPKVPAPMCDAVGVPANRRSDPARRRAARSAEGAIAPWNRVDSTERTMT